MPITPAEFVRRLYAQIDKGKGMRFSAEEMDMLAEMGAIDTVSKFAADWVRQQSQTRLDASRAKELDATEEARRSARQRRNDVNVEESARRARATCGSKKRARISDQE